MLWNLLCWVVFGLIIGAAARAIMPGRQDMSLVMTIVLGIVGSFAGGFVAGLIFPGRSLAHPAGWIMSLVGALIVLFVYMKVALKK